jgi:P4 family phage/plasmid primase-like protien
MSLSDNPLGQTFALSTFKTSKDNQPRSLALSIDDLRTHLTKHKTRDKKDGTAFSPVLYKQGNTRGNEGVIEVSCFILDIDDGTTPEQLEHLWGGLDYILYTSFSHTNEKPKYRVVFPLAKPVPASEWRGVWFRLSHALADGHTDPATKDPARLYFLPSCTFDKQSEAFANFQRGDLLDPFDMMRFPEVNTLDTAEKMTQARTGRGYVAGFLPRAEGSELRPGDDYNQRGDIIPLLESFGWQVAGERSGVTFLTRPGKNPRDGVSASFGHCSGPSGVPLFYVFSSSASPFQDGHTYSPLGVYATLKHGGNFTSAARELGTSGFGESLPPLVRKEREKQKQKTDPLTTQSETEQPLLSSFALSDSGNAERLVSRHGENIRFVLGMGWRHWTGTHWEKGEGELYRLALETLRALYQEGADHAATVTKDTSKDDAKAIHAKADEIMRYALKCESARARRDMVALTEKTKEVEVKPASFALRPWLVAFQNGTWDAGKWRGHEREDYIESLLPVDYNKKAERSEWLALLDRMTGGDLQLQRTLQDAAGYALSGASSFRSIFWCYGPKGTGKSTFCDLLDTTLGESSQTIDQTLLSGQKDIVELGRAIRSKRLLLMNESGTKRFDNEILKSLSGSDSMPCRLLYQNESFNVSPTWAVFLTANDAPNMNAHDEALKDRVIALPFTHALDEGKEIAFSGGRRLEEVRRDATSPLVAGFVAWAVEGLERVYQSQEIYRAPVVCEHTRQFWMDTDPFTPFWETLTQSELERGIAASDLQGRLKTWCESNGIRKYPQGKTFGKVCRAYGLDSNRKESGIVWYLPHPTLPLETEGNPVGMYEKHVFSKNPPREKDIGEFTENRHYSYIPTGNEPPEFDENDFAEDDLPTGGHIV